MSKQQKIKGANRVNFQDESSELLQNSDTNKLIQMKEKSLKEIEGTTKSKVYISPQQANWDMQAVKEKLQKFVKFLKYHNVEDNQIWKRKKELSITEFANLINENYGYYLSNDQLTALLKLCTKKQSLRPKDFQPLDLWVEAPNFISMNRYAILSSHNNTVHSNKFQNSRITHKNELNKTHNDTIDNIEIPQASQSFTESFNKAKSYGKEGFKEAQKYSQAKVQSKVQNLKKDIKESVLEKKWDFIVMAGEMNQWIDQLKKGTEKEGSEANVENLFAYRFKVLNKDPVEIIQQNIELKTEESIPHVVFIKKYQTLKKKMVKEENNKNNLKGTVLMVLEDQDKFSKNTLIKRINDRDQELNFVLLQIMRMKSLFQWQNNILKEAKINC